MSDSDDDGPPPPHGGGGTGLYRRLTLSSGMLQTAMGASPTSKTESPMSHQSSFQWENCKSFRLYAGRSLMASRRGTTFNGESVLDLSASVGSPSVSDVKSAFKSLKDYILLYGTMTVGADSQLPVNIRKGNLIGSGGFADVYAGINTVTSELVAIKEIRITDTSDRKELASVEEEFALLRQLRHPNVVRYILFEQSVSQRMCRIVMEFMAGGSVLSLLQNYGPLTEPIAKKFATDMLNGIAFIHREGIIHRDIKPANLLVSTQGQLKLADFGCSKRISELNTAGSCIIGTPVYMAPEFIRGQTTPAADIWAMGCTLFEMTTGLTPWHHTRVKDNLPLMFYITTSSETPMVLPADDPRLFSDGFVDFLENCFIRDPTRRPTAEELLKHPWIVDVRNSDAEGQKEIEDVSGKYSMQLCRQLCTETLMDAEEVESATTTPRFASNDNQGSFFESPQQPLHPSNRSSPQSRTAELSISHIPPPAGMQQQYLLMNPEKGSLEFANLEADDSRVSERPFSDSLDAGAASRALESSSPSVYRLKRTGNNNVSFIASESSPSIGPTAPPLPNLVLEGPVRMSFSFHANGEKVNVGLDIEPEDVTCRMVDRRPSFVVAMNDHIKGQLARSMAELTNRRNQIES